MIMLLCIFHIIEVVSTPRIPALRSLRAGPWRNSWTRVDQTRCNIVMIIK